MARSLPVVSFASFWRVIGLHGRARTGDLRRDFLEIVNKLREDITALKADVREGREDSSTDTASSEGSDEETALEVPSEEPERKIGKHEAHRQWWQPITEMKFVDPDQEQPRLYWKNNVRTFMTERGAPMTPAGFRKFLARLAVAAKFPFSVHPHMLRHATGYKLANDGRDTRALQHYLGHKNIMHTVRYTELSPERFKNFWED
jgi:Phage integrase family